MQVFSCTPSVERGWDCYQIIVGVAVGFIPFDIGGCPGAGQVHSSYHGFYPVSHTAILILLFYLTTCKVLASTTRIPKSDLSCRAVLGTLKSPLTSNLSSNLTAEAINCGQLQSQADWWYPQRNGHRQKWRKSLPNLPQPSNQRNKKAVSLVPP